MVPNISDPKLVVGQNLPHESAALHATGASRFIDDLPPRYDELFAAVVCSDQAHGRICDLNLVAVASHPGISAVFTAKDIPGSNLFGPIAADDRLLADAVVHYVGQPMALIVGTSRSAVNDARRLAQWRIAPMPALLTLAEAIAAKSFLIPPRTIQTGNVTQALANANYRLQGDFAIGGQEHLYFEPQSAIAYPDEQQTMNILSSTQHPTEVQAVVAEVLGIPFHRVVVHCRRMGGAFGGKETQAAQPAALAALAAWHLQRPVRLVLDRDTDMTITGKRHDFWARYDVGFAADGQIQAVDIQLFANGGCSTDLSPAVLERAMMHVDNGYYLPTARIVGHLCRTNLPSNTAFRGFGGPQGVACIENVMQEIAQQLQMDAADVRRRNLYREPPLNRTPYGQVVKNNVLPALFDQLRDSSDYDRRAREIWQFNQVSRTHVRGLALTTVKFGISFTNRTLNQANALVHVYLDGSVSVSTGATEMGQGVYTRIAQLVADEFGLPMEQVRVLPTSTDKNHNTSPTAASCGTDLNGNAALDATTRIRDRLAFVATAMLQAKGVGTPADPTCIKFSGQRVWDSRQPQLALPWVEVIREAYTQRVSLGERGFYATPGVDFDRERGQGTPYLYYTNGAAAAEVIIDRFTGELRIPRVDLLMDIGVPINPGIDRGQITGGFIQGMGWVTTEQLVYDEHGALLSHSPTTYKIPNVSDVPLDFRIAFFENPDNLVSLKRSKAVGEPPLLLGLSVWAAAKAALSQLAQKRRVTLDIPATAESLTRSLTELSTAQMPPLTDPVRR